MNVTLIIILIRCVNVYVSVFVSVSHNCWSDDCGQLRTITQRQDRDGLSQYHAIGPHKEMEYFFASDAR